MTEREKHESLIKVGFQVPPEVADKLPRENLAALEKYGAWLRALEEGEIQPITNEQARFLQVCKGYQNPTNRI